MSRFISALFFFLFFATLLSSQQTNRKTIKDPAEFNAYMTAFSEPDPVRKAAAMEAFLAQYPNSVVKTDAFEQAMGAYQQSGNLPKVRDTAQRLLTLDPNHVQALAILTFIDRSSASSGSAAALQEMCDHSARGLQQLPNWSKPADLSDSDFAKLTRQMTTIFEGAAGLCYLQKKDFAAAREHYLRALQIDPADNTNNFQLAIADLSMNLHGASGFWYCARALSLARAQNNRADAEAINNYCQPSYRNYHGSDEGWQQFVQQYGAQSTPPAPVPVSRSTAVCNLAVDAVNNNPADQLSFSDKEFILSVEDCSSANKAAAEKTWQSIQLLQKNGQARLEIPVKVIRGSASTLEAAVSEESQKANQPDMLVMMEPAAVPPPPGSFVRVRGVLTRYQLDPFRFTMEKGEIASGNTTTK